jgi:tripartite-type tricarboxylate transporter receptor subunit TctC
MMAMRNVVLALLGWLLAATAVEAQTFPSRPVTMYVTSAAGGVTDVVARAVGAKLSEMWGQPVIIENKGGAAHILGAQAVARASPDGHTLLVGESAVFVLNQWLYGQDRLGYEIGKDLIPITGLVRIYQGIAASNELPVSNIAELIALARKQPDKLTYGTAAVGSALHMNMLKFGRMADVTLQAIHYRGAAPALTDVMAGHINLICVSISLLEQPFAAHRLKILAVGSPQRVAQLPNVPTVSESGVPGFEAVAWFGLAVTGGTPPEIVAKINADVQKVMSDPAFRAKFMAPQMFESMATTTEEFVGYIKSESQSWEKIVREQHITIQ